VVPEAGGCGPLTPVINNLLDLPSPSGANETVPPFPAPVVASSPVVGRGTVSPMSGEPAAPAGRSLSEERLGRLAEVGRGLVSELDLELVIPRLLQGACELTGARYAALGIVDHERRELARFIPHGIGADAWAALGELPRGRGVLGVLLADPSPLRLDDLTSHPRSFGFPPGHPPMRSFLGVPILIGGEAFANLYLTDLGRGSFDQADEDAAVILAEWAGIAIENARRYSGVQDRRRELERAVSGLEATTEVIRAVGGETDLDRVLGTVVKRARALVEARSLVIMLEDRDELEVAATAGEFARDPRGERLTIGWTTWGSVLRGPRPERVRDVRSRLGMSPEALGVRARAALLVPLRFRGETLGVIAAFDRLAADPEFDAEDERLMVAFAASAATAVATAQTAEEERLRHSIDASERERRRWARELHDETLQGLGALRVMLASAARTGTAEDLKQTVQRTVDQLGEEIAALRGLITELRPAALDALGLGAAVEGLCEHHVTVSGLDIDDDVDLALAAGERPLDPELESALYRVIQEALTNVAKHARAEQVELVLRRDGDHIDLLVRDDGVGFDPARRHAGFGLLGMRERIGLVEGELEIISEPGSGTLVQARVPVERAAAEHQRRRSA
jgi:signal transduction histidine kinase